MDHDAEQGNQLSTAQLSGERSARAVDKARLPASAADIIAERLGDDAVVDDSPTVGHKAWLKQDESSIIGQRAWLKQDDYWKRTTYIAITGRQTRSAPTTRKLPRPHRFHKPAPARSAMILLLTLALMLLIPLGVLVAQREAESLIKLPTSIPNIPGLSEPTAVPTVVPTVTAKPAPKK